jgi:hypothetical protein
MREKATDLEMSQPESSTDFPERTLWLAVIERALKDYCFFFDRLEGLPHKSLKLIAKEKEIDRKNVMYHRTVGDFSRLRWFLFDPFPRPFNLTYLIRELYDDESIAEAMRKQAKEQFKLQLDKVRDLGRYQMIVKYVEENTGADKATPATEESKLRNKRYRLTTDV